MTSMEAARALGIAEIDEDISQGLALCEDVSHDFLSLIDRLQAKFDLFGSYYSLVKEACELLLQDKTKAAYLNACAAYYKTVPQEVALRIPMPPLDGEKALDFFGLFVMLPSVESAYDEYLARGFSHEEALKNLGNFKLNIWVVEQFILGRPAIHAPYYRWLCHYAKCRIFDHGPLNFELRKSMKSGYFLRNKTSGEIAVLMHFKEIHREGMPLRAGKFTDEEGAFSAVFTETEDSYIGHPVICGRVQKETVEYSKEMWELALGPEEDVIAIHIPRNTNLSPDAVLQSYRDALVIVKERFPEHAPKAFHCSSWLMDPVLGKMLGEDAKISAFQSPYHTYPSRNSGMDIFGYVFPKNFKSYEDLPEDTRLQRLLKQYYLDGNAVISHVGVIFPEEL